jgi:chromosome segregation ATPase
LRHLDEGAAAGRPGASELALRLEALEGALGERFGHLEETVRSEDIGRRLKQLELAIDERSGRLEEFVRTSEVERRLEELAQSVDERSARLEELAQAGELERRLEELARAVDARLSELQASMEAAQGPDDRMEALDQAMGYRLTRLEGTLRRMEEHTATHLEKLAQASAAAEVGILERIIAESQVVSAHFDAVRPVIEAAASAGPELESALSELRRLARTTANGESTGPHPSLDLSGSGDEDKHEELFLPPEETPIPERRFGGLLPRRDR